MVSTVLFLLFHKTVLIFFFLPKRLTDCHLSFKFQAFNEVLSYVFNSLHFVAQLLFFSCCLLFCESKPNNITMLLAASSGLYFSKVNSHVLQEYVYYVKND